MTDEGPPRDRWRDVLWWLAPLIIAAIVVAAVAAARRGDGSSPTYPLF